MRRFDKWLEQSERGIRFRLFGFALFQIVLWILVQTLVRPSIGESWRIGMLLVLETAAVVAAAMVAVTRPVERDEPAVSPPEPIVDPTPPPVEDRGHQLELEARWRGAVQSLDSVRASCEMLRRTGEDLSRAALRVSAETTTVAVTAEDADRRVAGLAASGREFVAAISRIGTSAADSACKGGATRARIEAASAIIGELQSASETIGSMTALIAGIAAQTNLLALNATIEAARAGEQGRGFAVVAGEVKALAGETAKAVATIADMVGRIHAATGKTVATIDAIGASVSELNAASVDISAAVATRIEAAGQMAASIDETAANIAYVASTIGRIEAAVDEAIQGVGFLLATADEIAGQEAAMRADIDASPATALRLAA